MTSIASILGVKDVKKSSEWYQKIFDLKSAHGGDTFEMLNNEDGKTVLYLHKWGEHEHPTLHNAGDSCGNGLILYFKVKDLEEVWKKAQAQSAAIEFEPIISENSGMREFACRDLDGYYLLVSL